jgi:hypothetical protein
MLRRQGKPLLAGYDGLQLQMFQQLFAVGEFSADGDRQVVFRLLLVKLCSLLLNMRSDQ